ncbi:hypothetical protein BJY04DRAFT_183255 [Aspergillus karnatakaensis]|uniref:uncharacterized protein n=1 Tax=Aspergillus karnatakaensis TaxID=1810916 RepID=UPI003CCE50CA
MPFTRLFFLILTTLFSALTTSQSPISTTIIELDHIFPRNETYAPIHYFPLVWGLQNATAAYPLGFSLYWRLSLADSAVYVSQGRGWFPSDEHMDDSYSYGTAPADPIVFNEFPITLRNFSTGRWQLDWKFGFRSNCSLVDPGTPDEHYRTQPYQSVEFTIAEGGRTVDLLGDWGCRADSESELVSAVAFEISKPHDFEPDQNCPVVNSTKADPCALQFNKEAVGNVTAAARELGRCESFEGELADFPVSCRNSAMPASARWTGSFILFTIGWLAVVTG